MAKLIRKLKGDFVTTFNKLKNDVVNGSLTASLEAEHVFRGSTSVSGVLVFERYSYFGGNRLSLTISLFQSNDSYLHLCAITAGGSQGAFFKINTIGENSFLDDFDKMLIDKYAVVG